MTSNSTPAPFLATSKPGSNNPTNLFSIFGPYGSPSYFLFDGAVIPIWVRIALDKKYYLKSYRVQFNGGRAPGSYTIEGSNDGLAWFSVDGITGNTSEIITRAVSPSVAYSQYQFTATSTNPSNNQPLGIVDLQYYGVPA